MLEHATPQPASMLSRARRDFSSVTDLADMLVRDTGMSFREAHHVVGAVVREALDCHLPACEIDSVMVDMVALHHTGRTLRLDPQAVARSQDPVHGVAARIAPGGLAPVLVRDQVEAQISGLARDLDDIDSLRRAVAGQRDVLKRAVEELAGLPD